MISPQRFSGTQEDAEPLFVPLTLSGRGPVGESLAPGLRQRRDGCVLCRWPWGRGVSRGPRSRGQLFQVYKYKYVNRYVFKIFIHKYNFHFGSQLESCL